MAKKSKGFEVTIRADANPFTEELKKANKELSRTDKEFKAIKDNLKEGITEDGLTRGIKIAEKAIEEAENQAAKINEEREFLRKNNRKDANGVGIYDDDLRKNELNDIRNETALKKYRNGLNEFQTELIKTRTETAVTEEKLRECAETLKEVGDEAQNSAKKAEETAEKFENFGSKFESAGQKLRGFSMAAGGVLAGLGAIGVKAAAEGAAIDDLAQRLGVSAEKAQEWQYVAVQLGVDAEVFSKAMVKARAAMLDLDSGKTNEQAKAMQSLGLSMSAFGSQEEMFDGVMDALSRVADKTKQAALANEIFGDKIANQLLPYLNAGQEAVDGLKEEWASLGGMSNEQVSKLAVLDDMIFRLKTGFKNIALEIGTAVMPVLEIGIKFVEEKVLPKIRDVVDWIGGLSDKTKAAIPVVLGVVAAMSPVLTMLGKTVVGIGSIVKTLPKLKSAMSLISDHPLILVLGVVVGLLATLYATNEEFRGSVNALFKSLGAALMPLLEIAGKVLSPIVGLLGMLSEAVVPLIEFALKPLEGILSLIAIPLKLIGVLLTALMPVFDLFAKIVSGVFSGVAEVVNGFLDFIEDAINWIIDRLNDVIGFINILGDATGWYHIDAVEHVEIGRVGVPEMNATAASSAEKQWDEVYRSGAAADISPQTNIFNSETNTDNSTKNISVNVTVEAHDGEVDIQDLVRKIDRELAEQM